MSLQHIQKNSPRLLPKPAKFEKNPPNGYRVIRKTKCGAGGAGSSPIHKQASLAGRLIIYPVRLPLDLNFLKPVVGLKKNPTDTRLQPFQIYETVIINNLKDNVMI